MKTNKLILLIISCLFITFCMKEKSEINVSKKSLNNGKQNNKSVTYDTTRSPRLNYISDYKKMNFLRKKMTKGDTIVYKQMKDIYELSGYGFGLADVSLIMANKNSFPQAYFDVYERLHGIDNNYLESSKFEEVGLSKLDPETRNLAFSYLKKAAAKGHKDAVEELKKYDKNGDLRK